MKLKLFTQPTCMKCPAAKDIVKKVEHKIKVENYDIKTEDGLAEALSYDVMATPAIILLDHEDSILGAWRGIVPSLDELNAIIK